MFKLMFEIDLLLKSIDLVFDYLNYDCLCRIDHYSPFKIWISSWAFKFWYRYEMYVQVKKFKKCKS